MQSAEKNLYPIVILQDFVNKAVLKTQLEKGSARAPDRNTPVDYRTLGKSFLRVFQTITPTRQMSPQRYGAFRGYLPGFGHVALILAGKAIN